MSVCNMTVLSCLVNTRQWGMLTTKQNTKKAKMSCIIETLYKVLFVNVQFTVLSCKYQPLHLLILLDDFEARSKTKWSMCSEVKSFSEYVCVCLWCSGQCQWFLTAAELSWSAGGGTGSRTDAWRQWSEFYIQTVMTGIFFPLLILQINIFKLSSRANFVQPHREELELQ